MTANRQGKWRHPAASQRTFVLGITGPMASGKSTVARMFAELGAEVIDADDAGRQAVQPGEPGLAEVIAEFGPDYLTAEGALAREALAERIFVDQDARERLNAILHPRMGRSLADRIAALRQGPGKPPVVVLEAAVLFVAGWDQHVDGVLFVTAKQSARLARLIRRQALSPAEARARIRGQGTPEPPRPVRWVLHTDGTVPEVRRAVEKIWQEIQAETGNRPCLSTDVPLGTTRTLPISS